MFNEIRQTLVVIALHKKPISVLILAQICHYPQKTRGCLIICNPGDEKQST